MRRARRRREMRAMVEMMWTPSGYETLRALTGAFSPKMDPGALAESLVEVAVSLTQAILSSRRSSVAAESNENTLRGHVQITLTPRGREGSLVC